jgi:hypothetical protein
VFSQVGDDLCLEFLIKCDVQVVSWALELHDL